MNWREFQEEMDAWELTRVAERNPARNLVPVRNLVLLAAAVVASALAIGMVTRSTSPHPGASTIERVPPIPVDAVTSSADPERNATR